MTQDKHICSICQHQIQRVTIEMYKRYGIHRGVEDYPRGHFEETRRLVQTIFEHMNDDREPAHAEGGAIYIKTPHVTFGGTGGAGGRVPTSSRTEILRAQGLNKDNDDNFLQ